MFLITFASMTAIISALLMVSYSVFDSRLRLKSRLLIKRETANVDIITGLFKYLYRFMKSVFYHCVALVRHRRRASSYDALDASSGDEDI
jgi:hypothetical protein